jgi:hypothetical protein
MKSLSIDLIDIMLRSLRENEEGRLIVQAVPLFFILFQRSLCRMQKLSAAKYGIAGLNFYQ